MSYESDYNSIAHAASMIQVHEQAIASYTDTIAKLRAKGESTSYVRRMLLAAQEELRRAQHWHTAMSDRNVRGQS
jgi:hypothetical protein